MNSAEKNKKLSKKTIIIGAIALLVVVAVVVTLVVCLGGKKSQKNSKDKDPVTSDALESETEADSKDETDDSSATVDTTDTAQVTEDTTETTTDTTTADTSAQIQSTEPTTNDDDPGSVAIVGVGSASEPYLEFPGDDMTLITASIPSGAELYYDIYRVGGMNMIINDPDAYVICDNLLYEAYNGQVYFQIPNALASDSVSFRIGNYGTSAKSFELIFENPVGSYANPAIIDDITAGVNVDLLEGNEIGFYFKHYAIQNGVIRFYMQATESSVFVVTNNRNSAQRTSDADIQTDENGNEFVEIDVNQGDELLINVGALPNKRGKYPAVEIYWNGIYN